LKRKNGVMKGRRLREGPKGKGAGKDRAESRRESTAETTICLERYSG